ncbi:MAG: hypothetical protein ACK4HF_17055 [Paracoccaceae bacterium]
MNISEDEKGCETGWGQRGYCLLSEVFAGAHQHADPDAEAMHLCRVFNRNAGSLAALRSAARHGNDEAANVLAWMAVHGLDTLPARPLPPGQARMLQTRFDADPEAFIESRKDPYPLLTEGGCWGFDPDWVAGSLDASRNRMAQFVHSRSSDCAVLIGNGPSLRQVCAQDLVGQDVFISNYAIRHPDWRAVAKGVAVTNRLVAEQEPHVFQLPQMWKFHPVWLGHVLGDSPQTVWLNALGGPLFFPTDLLRRAAWHATVSYFWLQILFHAGYRRVVMTGFDNSYSQPKGLPEGTLIRQETDDPNHFDPAYFRGKTWQSADTNHMSRTYRLARQVYEADGRQIINATVGGQLEDFPRLPLHDAINMVPV